MAILPNDKIYLDNHGYDYETHELSNETILVINNYKLSPMFDRENTRVLVRIPNGYPMVPLDMFWTDPVIKLQGSGSYPPCADYFGDIFFGASWQRFSRHYPWKQGYNLSTHLNMVKDVLVNGRG